MRQENQNPDVKDFLEFLSVEEQPMSQASSHSLLTRVKSELHPSFKKVFAHLLMIHVISATVTLFFCPQLGVSPFMEGMGFMEIFMRWGSVGCALACGSLFTGLSMVLAVLLLRPEEIRVAASHGLGSLSLLMGISYGILMLMGGESDGVGVVFWILGGVLSGSLILKLRVTLYRMGRVSFR